MTARTLLVLLGLVLTACQPAPPVCPTGTSESLAAPPPAALPTIAPDQPPAPMQVEIAGDLIAVDQIVSGPLCNGAWSGTVYVTCDVQVLPWDDQPTFLEDCDLSIAPETVVYVAYHNDAPYYNGCSCHTGEISQP